MIQIAKQMIPFVAIVLFSAGLHLYRITETIRFRGDEGLDMLVVWNMANMGHRPLVGPFLSLQGIYTPPTYYYITWFFYSFTHTSISVVYGFFFLNIMTLILLMTLTAGLLDKKSAMIVGLLFAASNIMITHGREFWSPFPMQVFLVSWLLALFYAYKKKSRPLFWLSLVLYQLALSVYPSPALLFPFLIAHSIRWYRHELGYSPFRSVMQSVLAFLVTFLIVFSPQIFFEIKHGFPTLAALASHGIIRLTADDAYARFAENVGKLFIDFFGVSFLFVKARMYISLTMVLLFFCFVSWRHLPNKFRSFVMLPTLLLGSTLMLFFELDSFSHRLWAYILFLFLIAGAGIRQMISDQNVRLFGVVYLLLYLFLNIHSTLPYWTSPYRNERDESKSLAELVMDDMDANQFSQSNTSLFNITNNVPLGESYAIFRILYWFNREKRIHTPLTPSGNDFLYDWHHPDYQPHIYLFCRHFVHRSDAIRECVNPFVEDRPYTVTHLKTTFQTRVFRLDRATPPVED